MRSSSFAHGTDEVTPMMMAESSMKNNGAIVPLATIAPEKGVHDVSATRFEKRFRHLCILLLILLLLMLIGAVLLAVVAVRLGHMERQVERAQAQLPRNVKDALNNFKIPMMGWGSFSQPSPPPSLPNVPPIQAEVHEPDLNPQIKTYLQQKECPRECQRKDFSKPPLVVLSLDGFAREYLDRFKVAALDYMAKCGATAERVYPPFPSRTFPSHYTMATGLYPESHGIVDNNIFDPNISDKIESVKKGNVDAFYQGDPIWNIYKRHGGRSACLYWVGCGFNISGLRPDISPPYNKDLPFRNRFEMIVDWLSMPQENRPGLITAYLDQPDSAGHYQIDDKDIESQLIILDNNLRYLIDRLNESGLLSCINLVIVSDHGMQRTNYTQYFSDILKEPGIVAASGVIGRVHKNRSVAPVKELMKPFECDQGKKWKVFQRSTMPTRKHYQKSERVGDVIIEGKLGTSFYRNRADDFYLSGDHGYDYIQSSMHTIFYAMGPSIKKGVVLPPIQNIEYLNLWLDLLGLPQNIPNNGTLGIMDEILVRPPFRTPYFHFPISECLALGAPGAVGCRSCSAEQLNRLSARLSCPLLQSFPFQISSTIPRCLQNYCEKSIITGGETGSSVAVVERIVKGERDVSSGCEFTNSKYFNLCSDRSNTTTDFVRKSLSADTRSELANIQSIVMTWSSGFVSDVLDPLNEYTQGTVEKLGQIVSLTGTAFDYDYNGIADTKTSSTPSHIYRVLIACAGAWSANGASCVDPSDTIVLSFIFPVMEKDVNCLPKTELLLDYTARLIDVEFISGLMFQFPNLSHMQLLRLKTNITTHLW